MTRGGGVLDGVQTTAAFGVMEWRGRAISRAGKGHRGGGRGKRLPPPPYVDKIGP